MLKSSNSMVSQANMSRLLKQMSLIVSTELQQIAIDLYEKMDESGGDKPVKYIKLKEEFRHHVSVPASMLPTPIPISHSTPQFKTLISASNQAAASSSSSSSSSSQSSSSSSSSSSDRHSTSVSISSQSTTPTPTLTQATKQHLSALIQMNSLTASFKDKCELSAANNHTSTNTLKSKQQQQQQQLPQIFNPKKDLEQFYAKEKKSNAASEMSAFRSTSSLFYSTNDTF